MSSTSRAYEPIPDAQRREPFGDRELRRRLDPRRHHEPELRVVGLLLAAPEHRHELEPVEARELDLRRRRVAGAPRGDGGRARWARGGHEQVIA